MWERRRKRKEKEREIKGGRGKKRNNIYIHTYIMNTIYMAYMGFIDLLNAKLHIQISLICITL